MTSHGTPDCEALPESAVRSAREDAAPSSQTELVLASIWSSVLRFETIGRKDDFIELGGDSILSIRVAARIRQAFGIAVALKVLFDFRTLEDLAGYIDVARLAGDEHTALSADVGTTYEEGVL